MRSHTRSHLLLLLLLATLGCGPTSGEDAFARGFIAQGFAHDSALAKHLEPGGEVARAGWSRIADMFPNAPLPADLRRTAWERGASNEIGKYVKLTYAMGFPGDTMTVDLWLVTRDSTLYVNTVQVTAPAHLVN